MKKQSNLSRLLDYAGTFRILSYLSWVLAAAGADSFTVSESDILEGIVLAAASCG